MKSFLASLTLIAGAAAHYQFPAIVVNGTSTGAWVDTRQWTGYYTNDPVTDVTSLDIRCNVGGSSAKAGTAYVPAGSTVGFQASQAIYHPGPVQAYLAKVPSGQTAATWDGSGSVWFKIFTQAPGGLGSSSGLTWANDGQAQVNFAIPKNTPSGEYLIRFEQIGLHVASSPNGAQFYLSCANIHITNGGSGTPGPLVAFPGAYKNTDPGLLINIYYPVPSSYTPPGPAVWTG